MMNALLKTNNLCALLHKANSATILPGLVIAVALSASTQVSASSLDTLENLSQAQLLEFSRNVGAATHYKSVSPAESLGPLGFDIGLSVSSTDISGNLFDLASDGDFDGSELILPSVNIHKGLPLGIDIGASIGAVPGTDAIVLGAELRYAIIDGGVATPAIGVRASYSQVAGVDDFDLDNAAVELGISKGFFFLTPYAGVGIVRTEIDPQNIDSLTSESDEQRKVFVGATINWGLALTLEAERTGDFRTYTAKAGFRF